MTENPPMMDRRRTALSPVTGEFVSPQQESGFRASIRPVWLRRARTIILISIAAHMLTIVNDYVLIGTGLTLGLLIAVRLVVALQGLGWLWLVGRHHSIRLWDYGLLLFVVLIITAILGITLARPDGLRTVMPACILVLCVFYMVPMTRLWATALNAAYLSLGLLAVGHLQQAMPPEQLFVFGIQLLITNVIGYLVCLRMHQDARLAWSNQKSLEQRERHQRLLAQLSSHFVGVRDDQLDTAVQQTFKSLCEHTGSDRGYLMEFDLDRETGSMTHEWCGVGITESRTTMQNIPSALMPWASLKLQRGEIVQVNRVSELPPEAIAERELNLAQGVQSFLCVPLAHEGRLHGMIGLDCVRRQRDWDMETVDLLRFIGQAIFNSLHRARAEETLRARESQLQTLTSLSPIGIFRTDADGYCLYFNEQWTRLTGLPNETALGNRWQQAVHPDDLPHVVEVWNRAVAQKAEDEVEFRYRRPDGGIVWVHARVRPHFDNDGKALGFIGTIDDITERRQAQEALEQRARLDECLNTLTVRFLRKDDRGPEAIVRQALAEVAMFAGADRCGYFVIDFPSATMSCLHQWQRPDSGFGDLGLKDMPLAEYGWGVPRLLRGEVVSIPRLAALPPEAAGERSKLQANGVHSLLLVPILSAGQIASFMSLTAARSEQEWGGDVALLMRIAGEMILNALERRASDHAQKQHISELESINLELERRNTDLQKLAYVASHDLQEPLRTVSSFSSLLERHYRGRLDKRANEYIGYITDASARLHRLINDLLAYTRVDHQVRAPVPCDFNEIVSVVRENLGETIQSLDARLECTDLPTVPAEPLQMIQLLQHLLANALRFHAGEPLRIEIHAERRNGEWILSVADNGIGIAPEHATRVFEIFQRLHSKDSYPGSGIGLAVCRRIVERHGGRIWVEPNPPRGSIFRFTLPAALSEPADQAAASRHVA